MNRTPDHGARAYQTEAERAAVQARTTATHERMAGDFNTSAPAPAARMTTTPADPADADPGAQRMAAAYNRPQTPTTTEDTAR